MSLVQEQQMGDLGDMSEYVSSQGGLRVPTCPWTYRGNLPEGKLEFPRHVEVSWSVVVPRFVLSLIRI